MLTSNRNEVESLWIRCLRKALAEKEMFELSEGGVGASHLEEEVCPGRRDSECKDVVQVRAHHV